MDSWAQCSRIACCRQCNPADFHRVRDRVMGDIVNLRKFRKQAKKREDAEHAAANRIVHGRSKAEREMDDKRTNKLHRHLDAHKIDSGDV